jgi:hypothetical protein
MNLLIVGGDSAETFLRRAAGTRRHVEHWTGRKSRDRVRSIPKATDAVVVVLDLVSHALVKRVRREASRRGLPVYFRNRRHQVDAGTQTVQDWLDPLRYGEGS